MTPSLERRTPKRFWPHPGMQIITGATTEMQTFLTSLDLAENARCLDNSRLGKQRVEVLQILKALRGETKGWRNHPATLMWWGHEKALTVYGNHIIREWKHRGFKNSIQLPSLTIMDEIVWPYWFWEGRVFASHRSNLLRKDPEHYGKFGWKEGPDLPYYWPVSKEDIELKRSLNAVLEFCP